MSATGKRSRSAFTWASELTSCSRLPPLRLWLPDASAAMPAHSLPSWCVSGVSRGSSFRSEAGRFRRIDTWVRRWRVTGGGVRKDRNAAAT
eukprot:scaffold14038_cov110-Isochrysis_galbana.AAC.7